MSSSLIQSLRASGELVLWHSYRRAQNYEDLSIYGNDGIATNTEMTPIGANMLAGGKITVANSTELEALTSFSMVVNFPDGVFRTGNLQRILRKRDATTHFDWYIQASNQLVFFDGVFTTVTTSFVGSKGLGISITSGQAPVAYCDGINCGNYNNAVAPTGTSEPLVIGNIDIGTRTNESIFGDVVIINRPTTDTEQARIHGELSRFGYPTP
jgi:hypothetical protein